MDTRFWSIAISMAFFVATSTIPEVHLPTYINEQFPPELAKSITSKTFSIMGISGIIGRLSFGTLTLWYEIEPIFIVQLCIVVSGLFIGGLAVYGGSLVFLYMFAFVFGAFGSTVFIFVPSLIATVFGVEESGNAALSGTYTIRAPLILLAAPVAAWVRNDSGTYVAVWVMSACTMCFSSLPLSYIYGTPCKRKT